MKITMNSKIINLVLLLAVSGIIAVGCNDRQDRPSVPIPEQLQENEIPGVKNLWILKKNNDNAWRIWDSHGNNMGVMMSTSGDKITWHAYGSDMTFEFEEQDLEPYFVDEDGRFGGGGTANLKSGDSLRVTVREDAPKGRLVYNVHVASADTMVVGSSPPVLILF